MPLAIHTSKHDTHLAAAEVTYAPPNDITFYATVYEPVARTEGHGQVGALEWRVSDEARFRVAAKRQMRRDFAPGQYLITRDPGRDSAEDELLHVAAATR